MGDDLELGVLSEPGCKRAPPSVSHRVLRQRNSRVSGLETLSSPYLLLAFISLHNNGLDDLDRLGRDRR